MKILYVAARGLRGVTLRILDFATTIYFRCVLGRCGRNSRVGLGTWISLPWRVEVGDNVRIGRYCKFGSEFGSAKLVIGDGVQINDSVIIDFSGDLEIQERALLSAEAAIFTHSHGKDPRSEPVPIRKTIGKDVWIGYRALILESCKEIGSGAVVGAGAVVSKAIPAQATVVGASVRNL